MCGAIGPLSGIEARMRGIVEQEPDLRDKIEHRVQQSFPGPPNPSIRTMRKLNRGTARAVPLLFCPRLRVRLQ